MTDHYHDPADLKRLAEFKNLAPAEWEGFVKLDTAVGRTDGEIDPLHRELVCVAVAFTTQCPYCIEIHTKKAKAAGASKAQVAEAGMIAAAIRAGGAVTHTAMALKFYDEA